MKIESQTKQKGKKNKQAKLSSKSSDGLRATLEGVVAKGLRGKSVRTNWDVGESRALRARLAQSWLSKSDLFDNPEDSFQRFCQKNGIPRNVLRRYLDKKKAGESPKKRGRPTLLSEDVMRHICEGFSMLYD